MFHHAAEREAELALGLEPFGLEGVARPAQIAEHAQKVLPDEMRQHEFVMQGGAPAHQLALLGLAPEPGDERAQQQLLGEAHARVRRHLEGAEFEQAQAPCGAIGRIELVDADLGAMGVAAHIHQQIAEETVHQPGGNGALARHGHLGHGDLKLVERVVARLVHARRLTRRADEEAGEEIGEGGMALPVNHQTAQQIGPAQERRMGGVGPAQHHMVAAACAGVATIDHEFIGAQPRIAGLFVELRGGVHRLAP